MKITQVQPFILHVPVTRDHIADSLHNLTHWGAPGVMIHADNGLVGYGYTGTHAHLPTDRLITDCIAGTYGPLLLGEDAHAVQHLWCKLYHFPPAQWVGRAGITQLALSAVDVALWDLKAKAAGLPLWSLLGGSAEKRVEAYDTNSGWINWPLETLLADTKRLVEKEGYRGVKIKIGSPDPNRDIARVQAIRELIGPNIKLMTDANGRWDLPTASRVGKRLDEYDVFWFEEPIWYDDVEGHVELSRRIKTPIALGEQLYMLEDFKRFIAAGAMQYVQADCVRLAGVSEWWQAADLALAYHLPVVAHIGDMMHVHLHLSIAHRACSMLEYIPWMQVAVAEPARVKGGFFETPETPGAGTTLRKEALEKYNVLR